MATYQAADLTRIHELTWAPEGDASGSVVLVHGYGEHIGRYDEVGRTLASAGFHVRGTDLRGHGKSGGKRGFCKSFREYLDDLEQLVERAREGAPELPLLIVGHSFGGLIATCFCLERAHVPVDGLALSSPYFGLRLQVPRAKIIAGRVMSTVYPSLALPSGLKGADVTRDPAIAAAYDRDPLNNKNATARWFTETSEAQAFVLANAGRLSLPLLLMAGGADPIADPAVAERMFAQVGSADKTLEILASQKHEIFNELVDDRKRTFTRLTEWLRARANSASGRLH